MYLDGWAPIGWATLGLARIVGVGRGAQSWPVESAMADGIGDGRCDHRRPMGSAMADGSGVEAEALTPRRPTDGRTLAGLCFFVMSPDCHFLVVDYGGQCPRASVQGWWPVKR